MATAEGTERQARRQRDKALADDLGTAAPSGRIKAAAGEPERCEKIALVLQGGGALGAYQAGVYEALHEAGIEPDWLSGVSIGAINSAIIAGNSRERRLERLPTFWERVTDRKVSHFTPDGDIFRKTRNMLSAYLTTTLGQPGFFSPRQINPWFSFTGAKDALSYYNSEPLCETLSELVDFHLINKRATLFSVGASTCAPAIFSISTTTTWRSVPNM